MIAGYRDVHLIGEGLEFRAYAATAPDGARVVLRTPIGPRFQSNANDPHVDTRALLRWEYAVTRHVAAHGVPVARARDLVIGDPDVLISDYVDDDGQGVDQAALGAVLKTLHTLPPPPRTSGDVAGRITRRWAEVRRYAPDLGPAPDVSRVVRTGRSLLHLDVRAANLRGVGGTLLGLLDWSNAVVGDPALELARLAEFARLPDNGLDHAAVLAGYGATEPDDAAYWAYRLDAAVMLALVFLSEAPDPPRARLALERVHVIRERLGYHLRDKR
ncbi:phosphotransferase family protein [Actinokineospora soli]|uniref:Phosphotransferase family protein n=1 Tax=Actinokineospora soli TaxID=1048753 RepID=A0ABW2TN36_9PSEU